MGRTFYDDDEFEDFLKQKADQYRLYPSGKAWNGIYNFLHSGRKWHTAAGTFLLITTLILIGVEIVSSDQRKIAALSDLHNQGMAHVTASHNNKSFVLAETRAISADDLSENETADAALNPSERPLYGFPSSGNQSGQNRLPGYNSFSGRVDKGPAPLFQQNVSSNKALPQIESSNTFLLAPERSLFKPVAARINRTSDKKDKVKRIDWLQERATVRLMDKHYNRFNLQFYFSPTASFRKLQNYKDPAAKADNAAPLSAQPVDVNGVVDHRPALGVELGSALLFNVSHKLVLKGGLQMNYVRYNIKAYKSYPERTAITLTSTGGPHSRGNETITSYSSIRNFGGSEPEDLQNQYVQVSIPLGTEFRLLGDKRFQLNVAGTVQPTYLLFNNTYLLSSDFNNYTKEPALVRRWNVNTAVEAYISYDFGGLRWQIGPQFRYQLLSTYTDRYPIREYLMEYGVKVGISKTIR